MHRSLFIPFSSLKTHQYISIDIERFATNRSRRVQLANRARCTLGVLVRSLRFGDVADLGSHVELEVGHVGREFRVAEVEPPVPGELGHLVLDPGLLTP